MRAVMTILVLSLSLLPISARAAESPVPIEGRILVSANEDGVGAYTYFIEGMSDNVSLPGPMFPYADLSPDMQRVAYYLDDGTSPPMTADVWIANLDESDAVNVSALAEMGGVNCKPVWSPDGSQLAFMHSDPTATLYPCEAGFHIWVMDTDGTNARRVTPSGTFVAFGPTWSPNGFRVCYTRLGLGAVTVDVDGTDLEVVPNVGETADWSPDGSLIASITVQEAVEGGESGLWRRLVLTDAEGGNLQILFERFLTDADVAEHIDLYEHLMPEGDVHRRDWVREGAGPSCPDWSPKGDRILFRAAIPFDPSGLYYPYQNDLWVYDLTDHTMQQITEDSICEFCHSWNGPNTFPDDPEVTVDDVTVTFSDVSGEGVTTILKDDDPPEVPTGFKLDYAFYELNTTAEVTGPITLCMTYTDEDVPPAAEGELAILHYDEVAEVWEDITTSRDTENNIICGQTIGLSPFALQGIRRTEFPDVPAWGYGAEGLDPHWAYYYVMACVDAQIVGGYLDGTYQPTAVVTRDQMAVYIARSLAGGDAGVPEFEGTPSFSDVSASHWAVDYVEYAVDSHVVGGYADGTYQPTLAVSRGQMAAFIARALAGGDDNVPDYTDTPSFPDVSPDFWAFRHVEYIRAAEVTQGYDDGLYHPESIVTRDQMAAYVARAFGFLR